MWSQLIATGLRGDLSGANLLGQTTLVVQALDLGLVVPAALFTAFALWRRRPIGYLLGAVFVVKALAMAAAILRDAGLGVDRRGCPEGERVRDLREPRSPRRGSGIRMYGSALPTGRSSGGGRELPRYSGTAARLSWALVPLMSAASLAGLLWEGLYRDAEWAQAAWFGNDLVTLFVAVPSLAASLVLARRGSRAGSSSGTRCSATRSTTTRTTSSVPG
jgi:hypothetical protein